MRISVIAILLSVAVVAQASPEKYGPIGLKEFNESFKLVYVETDGAAVDTVFIGKSKRKPSRQAKRWAKLVRDSADAPTRLAFAGDSSAKTAEVLRSTLEMLEGGSYPLLDILFIGDEEHMAALRGMTEALHARFRFVSPDT